jgi:hypothetical protein
MTLELPREYMEQIVASLQRHEMTAEILHLLSHIHPSHLEACELEPILADLNHTSKDRTIQNQLSYIFENCVTQLDPGTSALASFVVGECHATIGSSIGSLNVLAKVGGLVDTEVLKGYISGVQIRTLSPAHKAALLKLLGGVCRAGKFDGDPELYNQALDIVVAPDSNL